MFGLFNLPSLLHPGVRVSFPLLPLMSCSVASLVFFSGQGWLANYYPVPCCVGIGWCEAVLQQYYKNLGCNFSVPAAHILPSASQMRSEFKKCPFWWRYKVYYRAACTTALFVVGHISVSVGENNVLYGQLQASKSLYWSLGGDAHPQTFSRSSLVQEVTCAAA